MKTLISFFVGILNVFGLSHQSATSTPAVLPSVPVVVTTSVYIAPTSTKPAVTTIKRVPQKTSSVSSSNPSLSSSPAPIPIIQVQTPVSVAPVQVPPTPIVSQPIISSVTNGVIYGQHFVTVNEVYLVNIDTNARIDLAFGVADDSTIKIVLSSNPIPAGQYDLYVVNPAGTSLAYQIGVMSSQNQDLQSMQSENAACLKAKQNYQTAQNQYNTFIAQNPYMTAAQSNPNVSADVSSGQSTLLAQTFVNEEQAYINAEQNALQEVQTMCR